MNSIDTTTRTTRVCMHIMDVRAVVYSSYVLGIVRVVRVIIILLIISSLIRARNDINNTINAPTRFILAESSWTGKGGGIPGVAEYTTQPYAYTNYVLARMVLRRVLVSTRLVHRARSKPQIACTCVTVYVCMYVEEKTILSVRKLCLCRNFFKGWPQAAILLFYISL